MAMIKIVNCKGDMNARSGTRLLVFEYGFVSSLFKNLRGACKNFQKNFA
jgi:hypothetical protein